MNMVSASKDIYVFGAHSRARTFSEYWKKLHPDCKLLGFLYDNDEVNPESIDGVPVINLKNALPENLNLTAAVYLGIKGVGVSNATDSLRRIGFAVIIPVDVELDMKLRNDYLKYYFSENEKSFNKIDDYTCKIDFIRKNKKNSHIYVVSSAFDSKLEEKHLFLPFEKAIQVGTALSDMRVEDAVYDNEGVNISEKNTQFCELTALYWIWKNSTDEYIGIEHYRRFFIIKDNIFDIMSQNGIDAVLPVPLCVFPSLKENYLFRHENKPWNDMMKVIQKLYPDEYEAAVNFFNMPLYSPCNMIISRKEVFDTLCEWMFPIIFEVNKNNGIFEDRYQNRYPGFLSERLISFFFEYHIKEYNVVYADKNFLK